MSEQNTRSRFLFLNTHTDDGKPNLTAQRVALADLGGTVYVTFVAYVFEHGELCPTHTNAITLKLAHRHRTYLELEADLGKPKVRRIKVYHVGKGNVTSLDGMYLSWDGDDLLVSANTYDGTVPRGMEQGRGDRMLACANLFAAPVTKQPPVVAWGGYGANLRRDDDDEGGLRDSYYHDRRLNRLR